MVLVPWDVNFRCLGGIMIRVVYTALLLFFVPLLLVAQHGGSIFGKVIDDETGDPLVGANVVLEGTTKGAATDIEGKFAIHGIQPGTYTLIVSVVSYASKRIEKLIVEENQKVEVNISLRPVVIQTDVVVVEARAVLSYEGALLTQQKKAAPISDGISAEQIRRAPDATASDALRRVTSVSVVDDKYVFVRGTPERYSQTVLNGTSVASTEPEKRAFAFDILPTNLIENAVITKSFTPDLPGDFAGGLVKLRTIDFPTSLTLRISTSAAYSTISTFRAFSTYDGGSKDFLGIDDGTRRLPAQFPSNLAEPSYTNTELQTFARMLKNTWTPKQTIAPLNSNFSISLGDGATLLGQRFGIVTALTYRNSFETKRIERNDYEASGEPRFQYAGSQSVRAVSWGAIGNLSYKVSDFHTLSLYNTYSRNADDEVTQISGLQYTDIGAEQRHTALRYVSRSVYSGQLAGEHFFPFFNRSTIAWRFFISTSQRDEPDYRRLVYFREAGSNDPFTASLGFQANLKNGGRFYSSLHDNTRGFSLDINTPLAATKLTLGVLYDRKQRDFSSRLIGIVINGRGNGITDPELYTLPIDRIFEPANFRPNGFTIDEYQNGTNNYTGRQRVLGSYVMIDVPFVVASNTIRLIAGARLEHSDQTIDSKDVSGKNDIHVDITSADLLPSINLVYTVAPDINLRFAYSQTINRPELRELAPFAYFDFNTQTSIRGNERLQRSLIRNYDVRFEMFPAAGEILSLSFFYKSFTNAIEQVVVTGSALGSERSFMNADRARNYGVELEGRIGLGRITRTLTPFSLRGNYSWIRSSVDVSATEATIEKRDRPLQGQSPYTVNLGLVYEHPTFGTTLNLLFNRFGPRVMEVATAYEQDVIEQPRSVVDLTLTQPLSTHYELRFTAKDILAQEQIFTQGNNKARGNQRGTVYALGFSFKL